MIQLNIYRIKTYWNKKCCQSFCGRYCGRNCANDDTSMKFCKKVYKAVLLKTKLLATKKNPFFQDGYRKYFKHGRFYLAKSLNLSKPDVKLYWNLNFK